MNPAAFRALIEATDDSGQLQLADALGYAGESFAGVHRVQPFGFHSNPPAGAHAVGVPLRGLRGLLALLGGEVPQFRPTGRAVGTTALYDAYGSLVSLVESECRVVHATAIHLVAPTIILEGDVKLGGPDAAKPIGLQGSLDSAGDTLTGALATKVFAE
jgi:phage gp45-like